MVGQADFKRLVRELVVEGLPDELDAFDEAADILIADLYEHGEIREQHRGATENAVMGEITAVLAFIVLLKKAFDSIKGFADDVRKASGDPDIGELEVMWRDLLEQKLEDKAKARELAAKFAAEVSSLVKPDS